MAGTFARLSAGAPTRGLSMQPGLPHNMAAVRLVPLAVPVRRKSVPKGEKKPAVLGGRRVYMLISNTVPVRGRDVESDLWVYAGSHVTCRL